MKVVVLGSGIIGVSTAWWLREAGYEVVVIDRETSSGLETSFANGGQISVSYAEPWANPQAPLKLLKWLNKPDAPLLFRPQADWRQWSWGLRFLRECLPSHLARNIEAMVRLAQYSQETLKHMRETLDLQYDQQEKGILNFYRDRQEFESSQKAADVMRDFGVDRRVITADEVVEIEPALAAHRSVIVGGDYTASDESGDCYLFTREVARHAKEKGVEFRYSTRVTQVLRGHHGRAVGVEVVDADGHYNKVEGDAVVVSLGSYTPHLVRPLGIRLPIYPTKGYSATFRITQPERAPVVSLTDSLHKVVYTRLGDKLRMAGTAEMAGYSHSLNHVRCEAMRVQAKELFSDVLDTEDVEYWTGLRPSTPSNVPIIGPTRIPNLYINSGHGTLGWTMGAGSGRAMADIISGLKPEPTFPFVGV